jgi:hypothetical protein
MLSVCIMYVRLTSVRLMFLDMKPLSFDGCVIEQYMDIKHLGGQAAETVNEPIEIYLDIHGLYLLMLFRRLFGLISLVLNLIGHLF